MEYPYTSYSWKILSDDTAIKHMDKSTFLHHGSGIPKDSTWFFEIPTEAIDEPITVILQEGNTNYDAQIKMDKVLSRYRLFWRADFSELIRQRFPTYHQAFSENQVPTGELPTISFKRTPSNHYIVDFIDPGESTLFTDIGSPAWTEQELEACIDAYFLMLGKELQDETYSKAEVNRQLREMELSSRTSGSVEFRMQNISAVLQEFCHPVIKGYLPRGKVGTEVLEKIKGILFKQGYLNADDYVPTAEPEELEQKVQALRKRGVVGKPVGNDNPKRQTSSSTTYIRDPQVKAWVLENAKGICELCGKEGPFIDKYGNRFLEVHHVASLADGGEDTIVNSVALCPNCHRKCHLSLEAYTVRKELMFRLNKR